mgnify:FL=1
MNSQNNKSSSNGFSSQKDQGLYPYFLGRPGNSFNTQSSGSANGSKEAAQNSKSNAMFQRPNRSYDSNAKK